MDESIIKYATGFRWEKHIEKIIIDEEDETTVYYKGRRYGKRGEFSNIFDTEKETEAFVALKAKASINKAKEAVKIAKKVLEDVLEYYSDVLIKQHERESFQQISDKGLESLSRDKSIIKNAVDLQGEINKKRLTIAFLHGSAQLTSELLKAIRIHENRDLSDDEIKELVPVHGKIVRLHGIMYMGVSSYFPGDIIEKYIWRDKEILHIKDSGSMLPDIEHVDIPYDGP